MNRTWVGGAAGAGVLLAVSAGLSWAVTGRLSEHHSANSPAHRATSRAAAGASATPGAAARASAAPTRGAAAQRLTVIASAADPGHGAGGPEAAASGTSGIGAADKQALTRSFEHQVWPILQSHGCVSCHDSRNLSPLHFEPDAAGSLKMLLAHGYLDASNPSSLLTRVASTKVDTRMPPAPQGPLTDAEIATLQAFMKAARSGASTSEDTLASEVFPADLLAPYRGSPPRGGPDNTFLTYYQLRRKIQVIFGDNWQRNGQDLWETNIDLFHGADFHLRFHEADHPSTEFLAGVDLLSHDVSARSYLTATGPFSDWPRSVPAPSSLSPSPLYRRLLTQLYERLLYRPPTDTEISSAYQLLRHIYAAGPAIASQSFALGFTVTATDPTGLSTSQNFSIPVSTEPYGLYQQYVDETRRPAASEFEDQEVRPAVAHAGVVKTAAAGPRRRRSVGSPEVLSQPMDEPLHLAAHDPGQVLRIDNTNTDGNVSVTGVVLEGPLPATTRRHIGIADPGVQVDGAWEMRGQGQQASYEDQGHSKGASIITLPLNVPESGAYRVYFEWRAGNLADNCPAVLVEVLCHDPDHLAVRAAPEAPPPGEAHFTIDETEDNRDFWDLKTRFRFLHRGEGVELSNAGTRRRVVADAVRLVPPTGEPILLRGNEAEGHEQWSLFNVGEFQPYNTTGPVLYDDSGKEKGKLHLLYHPEAAGAAFHPDELYGVQIGVPGHVDNDTAAPVIVHASESSPIVEVVHPDRAHVGATVYLDASASYNLQRTALHYQWVQTGGPRVQFQGDPTSPHLKFVVTRMGAAEAAWEGLCSALVRSPDFLFSRPPSLQHEVQPAIRRRLQLVKIAQDLVGRPPTPDEVARLDGGASLASFVNEYLDSQEFKDFYMHRIRLYLESHGSLVDDEPVRLWCYIAFHDLPFQQILTADYTVDPNFHKQSRPAYYGHTGLLCMKGFVQGKPGLPHFNYPAQVSEKFLGMIFIVPQSIVNMRKGSTAASTTDPKSLCYGCHKLLTPLAFQRSAWNDNGDYVPFEQPVTAPAEKGKKGSKGKSAEVHTAEVKGPPAPKIPVDDTDHDLVPSYPFRGKGMQAFALAAQHKEAFIRTIIQTHFNFYYGRAMRYDEDERGLYRALWKEVHRDNFAIRPLIRTLVLSHTYLDGSPAPAPLARGVIEARRTFPARRHARS